MGIIIDLIGLRFGRLLVVKYAGKNNNSQEAEWFCKCDCGNIKIINGCNLRNGTTKSCGCLRKEKMTTHGLCYASSYHVWQGMLQRCNNPRSPAYNRYGGRGMQVCKRWESFTNFFEDMGEKPEDLTIERIDNELGYFKDNCCWATISTQNRNQRVQKNNKLGIKGIRWYKPLKKYCVRITADCKQYHIGYFNTLAQAITARKAAELKYWG